MDELKLTALRDLAITNFPRARAVPTDIPTERYNLTLYGFTALVSANAPAIEQAAAALLNPVLLLSINWGADVPITADQRHATLQQAVEAAHALCSLTGDVLPWLPAVAALPVSVAPTEPSQPAPVAPVRPMLQPTPNQTTADAARYLGVTAQTMRSWKSNQNGPIQPVKMGVRNGWPTAELVRLVETGWKARGKPLK
jgi:hypothetical protein